MMFAPILMPHFSRRFAAVVEEVSGVRLGEDGTGW